MNNTIKVALPMQTRPSQIIDLDEFADLYSQSTIQEKVDLGSVVLYKAIHPTIGPFVLVNTSGAQNALLYV